MGDAVRPLGVVTFAPRIVVAGSCGTCAERQKFSLAPAWSAAGRTAREGTT